MIDSAGEPAPAATGKRIDQHDDHAGNADDQLWRDQRGINVRTGLLGSAINDMLSVPQILNLPVERKLRTCAIFIRSSDSRASNLS